MTVIAIYSCHVAPTAADTPYNLFMVSLMPSFSPQDISVATSQDRKWKQEIVWLNNYYVIKN